MRTVVWSWLVRKVVTFLHLLILSKKTQEGIQRMWNESREVWRAPTSDLDFIAFWWKLYAWLLFLSWSYLFCEIMVQVFLQEIHFFWCLFVHLPYGKFCFSIKWQIEMFHRIRYWLNWHFHFASIIFHSTVQKYKR